MIEIPTMAHSSLPLISTHYSLRNNCWWIRSQECELWSYTNTISTKISTTCSVEQRSSVVCAFGLQACVTVKTEGKAEDYPVHSLVQNNTHLFTLDGTNRNASIMDLVKWVARILLNMPFSYPLSVWKFLHALSKKTVSYVCSLKVSLMVTSTVSFIQNRIVIRLQRSKHFKVPLHIGNTC